MTVPDPGLSFDIIIVGGGSAGCALASRISANPELQVALLEAGKDTPPGHSDAVVWDSYPIVAYFDPSRHWTDLRAFVQATPSSGPETRRVVRYEQARVMGGGSSINGMMANRGAPRDYDEWARFGVTGWSWEEVLPYFRRLERDLNFGGPAHGLDGPLPIRRVPREDWGGFSKAAASALEASGLHWIADQNDGFEPGYFPITINNEHDHRVSAAEAYLTTQVRQRQNLTILPETFVEKVVWDGNTATGVQIKRGDQTEIITGREVVLAGGAIFTPAILQRSGVGPAVDLRWHGLPVVADLPGVGGNLQEHPQIAVSSLLDSAARLDETTRRHIFVGFRWSSQLEDCPPVDMYGVAVNRGAWHPLGQKMGGFLIWVNKAFSRGSVRLHSVDPAVSPRVDLNLLSDERDAIRLADGLCKLELLYQHPAMRTVASLPFPTSYSEKSRDLAIVSKGNLARTRPLAWAVDGPERLRERVWRDRISGGFDLQTMAEDRSALLAFVRERSHGTWHCCGTARMGSSDDPLAVCDSSGRVFGVHGLRVADASVMPTVPCANVNLPAIMIGEKMADAVLADWR